MINVKRFIMTNSTFVPSPISDSKCEYIRENCDSEKSFVSEDYTIGYQISGSCRIYILIVAV